MKISIQAKLLVMSIVLVLLTTTGISVTYYRLTKHDKHRESQQRIQLAFETILEDLVKQRTMTIKKFDEFLTRDNIVYWTTYLYNQDKSQILSSRFITSFLTSAATKLKEFGHLLAADQLTLYGANRRLLIGYHREKGHETVGGYVVTAKGNDAYLGLDDPSYVSSLLILDRHPVPEGPLPSGIPEYYEGEIPEAIAVEMIQENQKLGYRIVAPIYGSERTIAGVLVGKMFYQQDMIEEYAARSKTAVNFFGGDLLSIGTLPLQMHLGAQTLNQMAPCEYILNEHVVVEVPSITLKNQKYYQGGCVFKNAQSLIGAITVSLSQEIENAEIRRILTAVFTISGVSIVICVVLISWIMVPTLTGPIITLTQAALKMAKGDLQAEIDTSGTDEIGTLAHSFVHMRDEIQKKQEALQRFTEELEQRVKERTAEITRQKYILDTFMENVPDSIYFKDLNSRIIRVNNACALRLGLSDPTEEIGKTDFDLFPEDIARIKYEQEQKIIRTGKPLLAMEEPDGMANWDLTTKMPLRDEHGKIIGTFGISRDITKLKQAEEALKHAKEAAEAANRAKSEFLANMSHELRTPLNVILGFTQIMARNPRIPSEERENLDIIRHSGEHLLTLINNVLDMSKIEAERIVFQATNINLFRLLAELEEMFSLKASQKRLSLVFERTADVPRYICTDEVKLRQVLMNLLNNAVKFTNEGGIVVRVKVCSNRFSDLPTPIPSQEGKKRSAEALTTNLQFEVEDTGPGIPPNEIASLFNAFSQTQTGRQAQEGTGLGLTISQRFVQVMGGEIAVHSEVGHGATFAFVIPVEVISDTDVPMSSPRRRVIALEPGQPRYRILIVDDKPDSRRLLVKLLTPLGFDLREVSNGQEAITVWEQFMPHVIWMDIRMQGMDGYEVTRRIRNEELRMKNKDKSEIRNPKSEIQTIIIALTSSSFEDEQTVALSTGFNDLLRKPFREMDIFEIMHKHLGVRYVYEEGEGQRARGEREEFELTPTDLAGLPKEVFTELQQAVNAADPGLVMQLIAQIDEQNSPLTDALIELVKQFRFDLLQKLFE
jgi:PAS domain S-box-containing protein